MVDRKPCIRCTREIDGYARICPFCNWDQSESPSAEPAQPQPELAYTPPKDRRVQKKLFMIGGGVVLLIASFLIGILIHGSDPDIEEEEARTTTAAPVKPPKRADVTLVPVTADDLETPITSAPLTTTAEGLPTEYQRSDATAVSSDEYALLAARVKEERRKARAAVDPRSLTGAAYDAAPKPKPPDPPAATEPAAASEERPFDREMPTEGLPTASRTRPVPEYQPLPNISVSERTTARLDLVIGADGRVKEVTVRDTIPGQTSKILAAVQSWRFKPATENGKPVSSAYSVDLSFGNE